MSDILQFRPNQAKEAKRRAELVSWLRQMANHIEEGSVGCDPTGLIVVMDGRNYVDIGVKAVPLSKWRSLSYEILKAHQDRVATPK